MQGYAGLGPDRGHDHGADLCARRVQAAGIPSDITKYVKGQRADRVQLQLASRANDLRSATPLYVTGRYLHARQGAGDPLGQPLPDAGRAWLTTGRSSPVAVSRAPPRARRSRSSASTAGSPTRTTARTWPTRPSRSSAVLTVRRTAVSTERSSTRRAAALRLSALIDGCQEAITIGNARKLELFCSKATFGDIAKDPEHGGPLPGQPGGKVGRHEQACLAYSDGDAQAHLQVSRAPTNDNQIWGFDPSQIILKSIGGAPPPRLRGDGLTMARQSASAGYEECVGSNRRSSRFRTPLARSGCSSSGLNLPRGRRSSRPRGGFRSKGQQMATGKVMKFPLRGTSGRRGRACLISGDFTIGAAER